MKSVKKIGTHSGVFHADDVTALMMLCFYTKDFKGSEIVRTRDLELLKQMDLVVDVGGEYDVQRNRFDHHQRGFEETFGPNFKTKLSGSGLIFKHFGLEVLQNSLEDLWQQDKYFAKYKLNLSEDQLKQLQEKMYENFFEYLDGVDNGIARIPKDIEPLYRTNSTNICARVQQMNPKWWSDEEVVILDQFKKAMVMVQKEYLNSLQTQYAVQFIAYSIVEQCIQNRKQIDDSGQIVFLDRVCFWKQALFQIEEKLGIQDMIKFVIFPDKNSPGYRVQAAPKELGSFETRIPLHKDWRGLDQQKLKDVSKIDDIIFCHHSGFIGGALSYESALEMARRSLNNNQLIQSIIFYINKYI